LQTASDEEAELLVKTLAFSPWQKKGLQRFKYRVDLGWIEKFLAWMNTKVYLTLLHYNRPFAIGN